MTIILLEGPDGSGKDRTLDAIRKHRPDFDDFPRACTSEGGPVDDLAWWVDRTMPALDHTYRRVGGKHVVLNRHPLVSELIYGPICRGHMADGFNDAVWLSTRIRQFANLPVIVWWHMPPESTIESYLDTPGRVDAPGVETNIYTIYAAYRAMMAVWPAPRSFIHDYTRDPNHTQFLPLLTMEAPFNATR